MKPEEFICYKDGNTDACDSGCTCRPWETCKYGGLPVQRMSNMNDGKVLRGRTTIGIAGFGFVGQAVNSCMYFEQEGNYHLYDPPRELGDIDVLRQCEIIFCCLPTLTTDGKQNFSAYEDFFKKLGHYTGVLVIKSTVLLSNIESYLNTYSIVVNPEFLSQNDFKNDFYNQKVIVLGGRVDLCRVVEKAYRDQFVFRSSEVNFEYCSVKEAIELKYTHNIYHAYKVLYWNYVHEVCGNQRKIFDLYSKVTGNTNEMARVFADGKAGYGGACFPKDVKAFHSERPHVLTEFMDKYNESIRSEDD